MKTVHTLYLALVLFGCSSADQSGNAVLTSSSWITGITENTRSTSDNREVHKFLSDGTYFLQSGNVQFTGKWQWIKDDEIYLQKTGLIHNGETQLFDESLNSYLKVIDLQKGVLRTVERHEGDLPDSGFSRERVYNSEPVSES